MSCGDTVKYVQNRELNLLFMLQLSFESNILLSPESIYLLIHCYKYICHCVVKSLMYTK